MLGAGNDGDSYIRGGGVLGAGKDGDTVTFRWIFFLFTVSLSEQGPHQSVIYQSTNHRTTSQSQVACSKGSWLNITRPRLFLADVIVLQ